jgi:hypothetical protein
MVRPGRRHVAKPPARRMIDHVAPLFSVVDLASNPRREAWHAELASRQFRQRPGFRGAVHPSLHTTLAVCPLGLTRSHVIRGAHGASGSALQRRPPPPVDNIETARRRIEVCEHSSRHASLRKADASLRAVPQSRKGSRRTRVLKVKSPLTRTARDRFSRSGDQRRKLDGRVQRGVKAAR